MRKQFPVNSGKIKISRVPLCPIMALGIKANELSRFADEGNVLSGYYKNQIQLYSKGFKAICFDKFSRGDNVTSCIHYSRGGGGTPSYKPYRYVPPQRVWFLVLFGLKTGIHFAHFGLESGMVFEGTT